MAGLIFVALGWVFYATGAYGLAAVMFLFGLFVSIMEMMD